VDRLELIRRSAVVALVLVILTGPALAVGAHRAGWQPLIERSGSMAPRIHPGNLVMVRRVAAWTMRPGQVVTFGNPHVRGATLTHRVVRVVPQRNGTLAVTTRGDANRASEHWTISPVGTVGLMHSTVALPKAVGLLLDRSHQRGYVMLVLSILSGLMTLVSIWRRPSAPAETPCGDEA
jgi:signal peptidase I